MAETFKAAQQRVWDELRARGWTMSHPSLKTRHATSQSGLSRIKSQALLFSEGAKHTLGEARSLHVDVRGTPTSAVVHGLA